MAEDRFTGDSHLPDLVPGSAMAFGMSGAGVGVNVHENAASAAISGWHEGQQISREKETDNVRGTRKLLCPHTHSGALDTVFWLRENSAAMLPQVPAHEAF